MIDIITLAAPAATTSARDAFDEARQRFIAEATTHFPLMERETAFHEAEGTSLAIYQIAILMGGLRHV